MPRLIGDAELVRLREGSLDLRAGLEVRGHGLFRASQDLHRLGQSGLQSCSGCFELLAKRVSTARKNFREFRFAEEELLRLSFGPERNLVAHAEHKVFARLHDRGRVGHELLRGQSFRRGTRHGPEGPITGLKSQLSARLLLDGREVRDLVGHQELRTRVPHQAVRQRLPVLLGAQEFALPVQSKLGLLLQRVLLRVLVGQAFRLLKQSLAFLHQESHVLREEVLLGDRVAVLPFSRVPLLQSRQEFGEVGLATSALLPHIATSPLGLARGSALRVELVLLHESLPDGLLARVLFQSLHREAVLFRELLPVFLLRDFGRPRARLLAEEQLLVGGELSSLRDLTTCSPVAGRAPGASGCSGKVRA